MLKTLTALAILAGVSMSAAHADSPFFVSVNEWGGIGGIHGGWGVLAPDPGPGGSSSALTFNLLRFGLPSVTPGDVLIIDTPSGSLSDVVRFNDSNTGGVAGYPASLVFYSAPGGDTPADNPDFPFLTFYPDTVILPEVGLTAEIPPEWLGAYYHPSTGMPGYVPGFNVEYQLISEMIPEPSTWAMMLLGFAGLGYAGHRTLRKTVPIVG
jgi:PEP-CTERM motif